MMGRGQWLVLPLSALQHYLIPSRWQQEESVTHMYLAVSGPKVSYKLTPTSPYA